MIMRGDDLAGEDDPLNAEIWASHILGIFYKTSLPLPERDDFEKSLVSELVKAIEKAEGEKRLRILRVLGAVAPDPIGPAAHARAEELVRKGVSDPPWASEIGEPEFLDAWMTEDLYGDQRGYFAQFRYPGRQPHTITALYDVNLDGIVKDAFAGYPEGDLRSGVPVEDGVTVSDADPRSMASEILAGISMGDLFVDNDWTEDFKMTRALLLTRMRGLLGDAPPERSAAEPLPQEAREELVKEFLHSGHSTGLDAEESILHHCLDFRCDYADGDPLRWSPIGIELFMMDYLPRKVTLNALEIRNLPAVLKEWVRFTLSKGGMEERWITEAESAVDRWAPRFKKEIANPDNFGTAKAVINAMMGDGVDVTDQRAVNEWVEEFNRRPFVERDEFLRDR